ncbi:hypothetical protein Pmani_020235 [Petrolisthes manimaculis]|uniref:Uncharacterized protein n=1 Tax=Petrolisthes manimaculis TaxID=1843537 RepID=A0AAE1U6L2_9EUCA|nr:hypothetical protein Pmani_020235 [Petrolisthes manimaculis]
MLVVKVDVPWPKPLTIVMRTAGVGIVVSQGHVREMRKRLASGEGRPTSEGHLFPLAGTFTGTARIGKGKAGLEVDIEKDCQDTRRDDKAMVW